MQRRAGAKGFGLFTEEALSEGQFVIEYIGEVLEEEEYLRRKEYYQESGQRHYYFMNVGNGEVIDACRKVCPASQGVSNPVSSCACWGGRDGRHGVLASIFENLRCRLGA